MEKQILFYVYDEDTGRLSGTFTPQVDPMASERLGHTVYTGAPNNTTEVEPLPKKEGYFVKWNGSEWEYEENSAHPRAPEVIELTPAQIIENEIWDLKGKLADTDYVAVKIAEGAATKEEYADIIAERQTWRDEINKLQQQLADEKESETGTVAS